MLEPGFKSGLGFWSLVGQSILSASRRWAFPSLLQGPCVYNLHPGTRQPPTTMLMSFSHLSSNSCLYIPKLFCEKFNMSVYSLFIHCLRTMEGPCSSGNMIFPIQVYGVQLLLVIVSWITFLSKFICWSSTFQYLWSCSYLEIVFTEVATRLVFTEVKTILEWAPIK